MSRAVRVLVILGGIPLYGHELAAIDVGRRLRDAGAEVLFVTNAHWGHVAVNPRLDAFALAHAGLVFFGAVERRLGARRLLALLRLQLTENIGLLRLLLRFRPTHVHVVSHWDFLNLAPVLLAWPCRMVFTAGNVPVVRHRATRWLWRILLLRTSILVTVSRFVAGRFAELGLSARRMRVIPNGLPVRPPHLAPSPAPGRQAAFCICYVGQIQAFKGVGVLVEAVRSLLASGDDVACWLVGGESGEWSDELRRRVAADPRLAPRVLFAGYVADPAAWLAACDVHVAPSQCDEAFGMVVAEAKSAGRPSVVTEDGGLPELVRDGVDGRVVAPGDVADLVGALRSYLTDPATVRRHGEAARESLRTLGIADVDRQWREVYGLHA